MLYNILIFPTKIKEILDLIKPLADVKSQYELELKFKSNLTNEFNNWLAYFTTLSKTANISRIVEIDTVYSYNLDENTTVRKIESEKQNFYQTKTRIQSTDFALKTSYNKKYDYRLSLAIENEVTHKSFDHLKTNSIRQRDRNSFLFENFRIDFTVVKTMMYKGKSSDQKSYEVEIEYIDLPSKIVNIVQTKEISNPSNKRYEKFAEVFKYSLSKIFPQSHTMISTDNDRYSELLSVLDDHKENKPINIQDRYLDILRNSEGVSNYSLTNKLDGTKYNLFVIISKDDKVQTLILANNTDLWLLYDNFSQKDISLKSKNIIYALDVEILDEDPSSPDITKIFIFDTIFGKTGRQVLEKLHADRLAEFNTTYLDQINNIDPSKNPIKVNFKIFKKVFIYEEDLKLSIKSTVKLMWSTFGDISNVERMNDGIIFQPVNLNYYKDYNQPILKWKFPEKVTIDFMIKKHILPNMYELYVYNDKIGSLEEFSYKDKRYLLYSEEEISNNMIYETSFNTDKGYFIPYRPRYDKTTPNSIGTARDTFKDLLYPFLLERIINYLNGVQLQSQGESSIEITEEPILENKVLACDTNKLERLFYLPRGVDSCKLNITSDGNKYNLGWKAIQGIINEVIVFLNKIDKSIEKTRFLECFAYSGCDTITLATGKLTKGSAPRKFYEIISFEADKLNYDTLVHNINTYNHVYYAKESYKQFRNISKYNVDFLSDYNNIIAQTKSNVIFINNPNLTEIRELIIEIFKKYSYVDLIILKLYPNLNYKALKLYYDIKFGIMYIPKCLNIYRKIHNEIKTYLIKTFCDKARILDLGSGKGGDLFKYNTNPNIQMIYLVEPSQENIKELNERITKLQVNKENNMDLTIINAGAQDTTKIISDITKIQNTPCVDVITSFFSLTFLFETEFLLDRLVSTIVGTLGKNKVFIGTVMDGYRTLELLKQNRGEVREDCYTIKSINDHRNLRSNDYGNLIEINLKSTETATTQTEYLVFLDLLTEKLKRHNIELVTSHYFDDANIDDILENYNLSELLQSEVKLNRLYRFFVYKKIDKSIKPAISSLDIINITNTNYTYIKDNQFTDLSKDINLFTQEVGDNKEEAKGYYKRLAAIGSDNNCFFHSLLITQDFLNYSNLNYDQRIQCAREVREKTIKSITQEIFENLNFGMIAYPKIVRKFRQLIDYEITSENSMVVNQPNVSKNYNKIIKDFYQVYYKDQKLQEKFVEYLNKALYEDYKLLTNFTIRLGLVSKSIINYFNSTIQVTEEINTVIKNIVLEIGVKAKNQAYNEYISSLLEIEDEKYKKDIDNEDIQYINAMTGTMTILISNENNLPVSYTSFNPNKIK